MSADQSIPFHRKIYWIIAVLFAVLLVANLTEHLLKERRGTTDFLLIYLPYVMVICVLNTAPLALRITGIVLFGVMIASTWFIHFYVILLFPVLAILLIILLLIDALVRKEHSIVKIAVLLFPITEILFYQVKMLSGFSDRGPYWIRYATLSLIVVTVGYCASRRSPLQSSDQ